MKPAVACWPTSQRFEAADIRRRGSAIDDRAPERILHPETAILDLFHYAVGMLNRDRLALHVDLVTGLGVDMATVAIFVLPLVGFGVAAGGSAISFAVSVAGAVVSVTAAIAAVSVTVTAAIATVAVSIAAAVATVSAAASTITTATATATAIAAATLAGLCASGVDSRSGAVEVNLIGSDGQRQRGRRSERQPATTGRDRSMHGDLRRLSWRATVDVGVAPASPKEKIPESRIRPLRLSPRTFASARLD